MNPNVRKPDETQEAFKSRRKANALEDKIREKGTLVWNSKKQGNYIRAKHGELSLS